MDKVAEYVPPEYNPVFEAEFSENRDTLEVFGGEVNIVEINPDAEGPVILLAPGFISGNEAQKEVMRFFGSTGRRVLSVEHARRGGKNLGGEFHDVIEHPAESLLAIMDYMGLSDVHIVAHSAGFKHSVLAASKDDMDLIRSITGIGPAGVAVIQKRDQAKAASMVFRGARDMRQQDNAAEIAKESARYVGTSVNRTRKEAMEVRKPDIITKLDKVSQRIPVTILMQSADELFRPKTYVDSLVRAGWLQESLGGLSVATVLGKRYTHSAYLSKVNVMKTVEQVVNEHIAADKNQYLT